MLEFEQLIDLGIYPVTGTPALLIENYQSLLLNPQLSLIMSGPNMALLLERIQTHTTHPIQIVENSFAEYDIPQFGSEEIYYAIELTMSDLHDLSPNCIPYYTTNLFFTTIIAWLRPNLDISPGEELTPRIPENINYRPSSYVGGKP